jgi:hypothetical protein
MTMRSSRIRLAAAAMAVGMLTFVLPCRADDPTVVLSISSVIERGFRERVVSDLLQKYDCCVLSRSRGYDIAVEQTIGDLTKIERAFEKGDELPAATHVVGIVIDTTPAKKSGTGTVWVQSLSEMGATLGEKKFVEDRVEGAQTTVVAAIGAMLSLPPRKTSTAPGAAVPGLLTWAVLPVLRADYPRGRQGGAADADGLTVQVELALQEAGLAGKLVSHSQIEAVLQEQALGVLLGGNQNSAGAIARLLNADRIVIPMVSRWFGDTPYRVDVHSVDAATAAVIDAEVGYCRSSNDLRTVMADAVVRLARRGAAAPRISFSSAAQRRREAEFYLKLPAWQIGREDIFEDRVLNALGMAESAYMLARHEPALAAPLQECLLDVLDHAVRQKTAYGRTQTLRAGMMLENVLKSTSANGRTSVPSPLLAWAEISLGMGDYTQALNYAEQCAKAGVGGATAQALLIQACAQVWLGHTDQGSAILDRLTATYGEEFGVWKPRWAWDFRQRIVNLRADLDKVKAGTLTDTAAKYAEISKRLRTVYYVPEDEWIYYLQLLKKHEGPARTVEELDLWLRKDRWDRDKLGRRGILQFRDRCEARLVEMDCLIELGRREEAVRRAKTLLQLPLQRAYGFYPINPAMERASTVVSNVEREIGYVDLGWRTAAETRPFPAQYACYVVPVSDIDLGAVQMLATNLGVFLGTSLRILKRMPLPGRAVAAKSTTAKPELLWDELLKGARIPRDAIFVVFAINERMRIYSLNDGNPLLLPYTDSLYEKLLREYAKSAAISFRFTYAHKDPQKRTGSHGEPYPRFPYWADHCNDSACLYSDYPGFMASPVSFLMCPRCQEEYKQADFDSIHASLMTYLKQAGATVVEKADGELEPGR